MFSFGYLRVAFEMLQRYGQTVLNHPHTFRKKLDRIRKRQKNDWTIFAESQKERAQPTGF